MSIQLEDSVRSGRGNEARKLGGAHFIDCHCEGLWVLHRICRKRRHYIQISQLPTPKNNLEDGLQINGSRRAVC